ncbi:glycosyltransferase [Lactiplantibacillus modestisalitolerans]|uniref:Glycosyltransferase n=1 Tax=Lactiplantibacillus modestisalitolerans TaxID=1457219 RepID=A0ABV5WUG1_9LACO|nr:glycosyltransferase [Lactiplantibacillus modestisalitolerans]
MKRILLIGMTSGIGGVETFITNLLKNIDKTEFQVDLLLYQRPNDKYAEIIKTNVHKVFYVNSVRHKPLKWLANIIYFYAKNKYDVVHINECSAKTFLYAWPVAFLRKTKLIVHSHNGSDDSRMLHYMLRPFQQVTTAARWSCSDKASRWMFGNNYARKYNVTVIQNGIDTKKYRFTNDVRSEYRKALNISDDQIVLGSIARLEKQKNHTFLLDIFKSFLITHPNSLLLIIGDGSLKQQLIKKANSQGMSRNVCFLGNRNDIPKLLQVIDVLVMPSLYEGLPFVGMEAQASGVPIVASNTVDHNLDITGKVSFISLDSNPIDWVKAIDQGLVISSDAKEYEVIDKEFSDAGYLLQDTVSEVEDQYIRLCSMIKEKE